MRALACNMFLLLSAVVLTAFARGELAAISAAQSSRINPAAEVLYLPSGRGLEVLSFGYQNILAHLLWFNTTSYFGKHYRGDKDYRWLSHMCNLVTRLNPKATHVFQFCGTMLAWEGNMPEQSIAILSKAIELHPANWLFYYLRGFTYIFFLGDDEHGKSDFIQAARLPEVHPIVIRLASKKILSLDSPETAIEFLRDALQNAKDDQSRKVLTDRLKEMYYELGFQQLERAAAQFKQRFARLPLSLSELEETALAPRELQNADYRDPFGGRYYIDPQKGSVKSTSAKRRDSLHWKRHGRYDNTK